MMAIHSAANQIIERQLDALLEEIQNALSTDALFYGGPTHTNGNYIQFAKD
jgi:hypothetical protein